MSANINLGHGRVLAVQAVPYTASSAQATNPFGPQTFQIRIVANSDCHVKVGSGSLTATTSDPLLPAGSIGSLMVSRRGRVAAGRAARAGLLPRPPRTLQATGRGCELSGGCAVCCRNARRT